MNVLVTGGAGFIGLNLIAYLRSKGGYTLKVLDDFSLGQKEYLDEFDVEVFEGDILDEALVSKAMQGVQAVVHLAADTRVIESIENPAHNFRTNVNGTFNILQSAKARGIKNFVFASTGGAILGNAVPPVNESMLPKPISPYGASKLAGEGYCSAFTGAYGVKTVSLRFSNVYGPRSYHKGSVVAHFYKSIIAGKGLTVYGDGTQTRDYVHVDDIASGIENALKAKESGVYQLGTGVPTTINELLKLIKATVGGDYPVNVRYADFRDGEVRQSWCDIRRAKEGLGYGPKTALAEGLKNTYQWFAGHSALLKA